jgi:hypothetical protein
MHDNKLLSRKEYIMEKVEKRIDGELVEAVRKGDKVHFTHIISNGKAIWDIKKKEWKEEGTNCHGLFLVKCKEVFGELIND